MPAVVTTKRKSYCKNGSSNWEKQARLSGSVGRTDPAGGGLRWDFGADWPGISLLEAFGPFFCADG